MLKSKSRTQKSKSTYLNMNSLDRVTINSSYQNSRKHCLPFSRKYKSYYQQSSINDKILFQRKQNYLNSHFNKRKEALKQITCANHKIYHRINSQKSQYNQKKMAPFQLRPSSSCSSKSSRRSNQSNSRVSLKQQEKQSRLQQSKHQMTINSQSINQIKSNKLLQFSSLFEKEKKKIAQPQPKFRLKHSTVNMKAKQNNNRDMGNLLHCIQEEMKRRPFRRII